MRANRRLRSSSRINQKQGSFKFRFLIYICLIGAISVGGWMMLSSDYFTLTEVTFIGNKHLTDAELFKLSEIQDEANLIMLSAESVYENLHASPWLNDVSVRKELPSTLVVKVHETKPGAVLRSPSGMFVLDTDGIVLKEISSP